ncbi:MAG: hypothetical protein KatS3mg090_0657 [Patescibacteria group bacterium]|nr:MAG: hypothetical protein KatS3mg090_0657 [Patescibacteria group bacterium]
MKSNLIKIILITFIIYIYLTNKNILAINMQSDQYKIQFGNINIGSKTQTSDNYNLTTTLGQTAAQEFQSNGYIIKAGFQYIYGLKQFSFSLSNINIDFGTAIPDTPIERNLTLTITFPYSGDYQVTVVEEGPLKTLNNQYSIPDTQCDGGTDTCTETVAKPWTQTNKYGFGYNMSGNDIPSDFINSTYYRPFPDYTLSENPAVVMSSNNIGVNKQATMTLKLNISNLQPAGNYQTILIFNAVPSF